MSLDVEDIEAIARRVAELLDARTSPKELIDARAAARRLGVARAWVYAHAHELGGMRLGEGARAPLRFDPLLIDACVGRLNGAQRVSPPLTVDTERRPPRSRHQRRGPSVDFPLISGRRSGAGEGPA